jgi:acetoin utilization deacetylase AcuC-like enzyme
MTIALYTHPDMLVHQPGFGHPERPQRLTAVLDALNEAGDLDLETHSAEPITLEELTRVHTWRYIEAVVAAEPVQGRVLLDPDTPISAGSVNAAYRAAGAVAQAVRAVTAGQTSRAFCAVRPPGHHAEAARAMGFCIFSNVAIGARLAREAGYARVAVVDFDVHHGNGTQSVVVEDPSLFFASIHQWPLFPGTGAPSEHGLGNVVNATVPPLAAREAWRAKFEGLMTPLDAFAPELILISAGFDAHARDPQAEQMLEAEDFAWATRAIISVARARCGGRIVSSLEGGYDLEGLGRSALAHVRALQEG